MDGKTFISRRNSIATEHPLASLAALEILQKGGNAFDAAVAASFALTVLQPHLSGLGGDFFALFYSGKEGKVYCINSSGWSSSQFTIDAMKSSGHSRMPTYGPLSAVIPGYVAGVVRMHEKFGRNDFSQLLVRAVEFAEDGFPVGRGLINAVKANETWLPQPVRETLMPLGRLPRVGELIRQNRLGETIRAVARDGPDAFYRGGVAAAVCSSISQGGLRSELQDFSDFEPEWCEPISAEYRDLSVQEVPPNSMGATTLLTLKLLEKEQLGRLGPASSERIDATLGPVIEAYRRRDAELGDRRFVRFELEDFLRGRSSPRSNVSMAPVEKADTTYFAVSDAEGNLLSCIQSLFHHFGSRVYVREAGFFLNNRASAFRYAGPNRLEPRKRPLHTLSSVLVGRGDRPSVALGCSGGDFRPQQHVLLVTNLVDYSMSLEQAIGFPRFLWEGGNSLIVEEGYEGLERIRMKKTIIEYPGRTGVAQGVEHLSDSKKAVCDLRGEGIPLGN